MRARDDGHVLYDEQAGPFAVTPRHTTGSCVFPPANVANHLANPSRNLTQKAFTRAELQAEVVGDGLADVGERGAVAEVNADARARAVDEERGVLARVIRAAEGRVVAVVGGDDEEVSVGDRGFDFWQARVEVLQGAGVALGGASVDVEHVS